MVGPIHTTVSGIPCLVRVDRYHHQPPHRGSAWTCDSDMDFYGYSEVEWAVLDRRGKPAPWLERKLTPADCSRIEREIETAAGLN